jgi:WD40 repeat protein
VGFSPDGRYLSTGEALWDARTGKAVFPIGQATGVVAFSPDGRRLAITGRELGFQNKLVRVWDVQADRLLLALRGHTDEIRGVTWSPDGKRLATASDDKTVRVWDAQTGQETLVLQGPIQGHARGVTGVAFSPDGSRLSSASRDGIVSVWDASPPSDDATRAVADQER